MTTRVACFLYSSFLLAAEQVETDKLFDQRVACVSQGLRRAFACCLSLLVTSGPTGIGVGLAWLLVGLLAWS